MGGCHFRTLARLGFIGEGGLAQACRSFPKLHEASVQVHHVTPYDAGRGGTKERKSSVRSVLVTTSKALVSSSDALVTRSDALVTSSFLLLLVRHLLVVAMHLLLEAMHLLLAASCYY